MGIRRVLTSRAVLVIGVAVSVAVPVATLPRLPSVSPWPLIAGLLPWIFGKYVLSALRWRAVTVGAVAAPQARRWYLRAHAESELLGLLTPGHIGADVWRIKRLGGAGVTRGAGLTSVASDRFVGALGLAVFLAFAASQLPIRLVISTVAVAILVLGAALLVRRRRPDLIPTGPLPGPRALVGALVLSALYQLTIAGLLLGVVSATGNSLSPLQVLGAFGASQAAAAIPGINGASPRDGALVLALVALGVPWVAAAAIVTLRATLAWLPALALGGFSLWWWRKHNEAVTA